MIVSCNQDTANTKTNQNNSIDLEISDNKDIFGGWSMCAISDNDMMIQMNTCKTIILKPNGTGYIENNSLIIETFEWTLKNLGLKIIYGNKPLNSTFPDTTYYTYFTKQKDRIDLILRHKGQSYYLSK